MNLTEIKKLCAQPVGTGDICVIGLVDWIEQVVPILYAVSGLALDRGKPELANAIDRLLSEIEP